MCPELPHGSISLADRIIEDAHENLVGELLRDFTFVGEGFGCYATFDVREGAAEWDHVQKVHWWRWFGYDNDDQGHGDTTSEIADRGQGYGYELDGYKVDVCWFWDGDGVLTFCVGKDGAILRRLYNGDCKKDYNWHDMTGEA